MKSVMMRCLFAILFIHLPVRPTAAEETDRERTVAELQNLFADYNRAAAAGDRAALERLFADDYVWVEGNGRITPRAKLIENIIGNTTGGSAPSDFGADEVTVLGDTAFLRSTKAKQGLFATTVFVRQDGRWQFAHAQGTLLPPKRTAIKLDPAALDQFVGTYEFSPGVSGKVTKEGDTLKWKGGPRPQVTLHALSDSRFFVEESGVEMTFHREGAGKISGLTLRMGTCQDSDARKLD